jgi:hypothetical protein
MRSIDITDMLRIERRAKPWPHHHGSLFVLHRWEPSALRRSGVYRPLTGPVEASQMKAMLEGLALSRDAVQRFEEFSE